MQHFPVSFRPLSHKPQVQVFAVAEHVCAVVNETDMLVSGVHEDQCFASFWSLPGSSLKWKAVIECAERAFC